MNAFQAADKSGRAVNLRDELIALFESHEQEPPPGYDLDPATFLRVTVAVE